MKYFYNSIYFDNIPPLWRDPNCCCLINTAVAREPSPSLPLSEQRQVLMSKEEEAPKYQLEDILNKKKPPPQILDLHNLKLVIVRHTYVC